MSNRFVRPESGRWRPRLVGLAVALSCGGTAMGAIFFWTGNANPNNNWSNGSNWAPAGGTAENDDIVIDDTSPQPIVRVDSNVPLGADDAHDIDTLYVGDGHTLWVADQPLDVNEWMEVQGVVTIDCDKVLEGCPNTILRIGGGEATTLTKDGDSDFLMGRYGDGKKRGHH